MINPPLAKIVYCYGEFQPSFAEFPTVEFHEGLPNVDRFDGRQRVLLIIDDLMDEVDRNVSNLFTKLSHHRNVSVMFMSQNLFHKNKFVRTMNLNTHYIVLFKNPRDAGQVAILARQMYPRQEPVRGRGVRRRHERTVRLPADRSETGNRRTMPNSHEYLSRRRQTVRLCPESIKAGGIKDEARTR